jgi:hypothetical protein
MTDIQAWQNRLSETFGDGDGTIGHELARLDDAESNYGAWAVDRFRGFMSISEAFLVLHFEVPSLVNRFILQRLGSDGRGASPSYGVGLMRHAIDCRTLRAARLLFLQGYPFEGVALLRPVFDAALVRSAIVQGLTTVEAAEGVADISAGRPIDPDAVRRARIKEEKRIDRLMVGEESGLQPRTQEELAKWEGLLHAEIHGARLSLAMGLDFLKGKTALTFGPTRGDDQAAMLLNRWCEVAWMIHRLMPTLQLVGYPFPEDWRNKWRVLDESFVPIVQSLSTQLGKPIGDAMVDFVHAKFPFGVDTASQV